MMQTVSGGFQMLMSETQNPVVIGLERFIYIFSDISYIHTQAAISAFGFAYVSPV